MCNAINHPAQREVKMSEGFYGKGKRREVWVGGFSTRGSENLFSIKLAPSIRKPSVSLKSLEWGIKLLIRIVATPSFCSHCALLVGWVLIGSDCLHPGVHWVQVVSNTNMDDLCEGPLEKIVIVSWEECE